MHEPIMIDWNFNTMGLAHTHRPNVVFAISLKISIEPDIAFCGFKRNVVFFLGIEQVFLKQTDEVYLKIYISWF